MLINFYMDICKEHSEKIIMGCIQCQRSFCKKCKEKMKKCNINDHDLLPYREYLFEINKP